VKNGQRYIVVTVAALVALIAVVLASYAYLEYRLQEQGAAAGRGNATCSLRVLALNGTAEYTVDGCTLEVKSRDTFVVLWLQAPYRVEEGWLRLRVSTEKPLSMIVEYAPSGSNVTGSRIVFPVKGEAEVRVRIVHGAVDQVYIGGKPAGRAISPYILASGPSRNLLKITLWGPLGVEAKIDLLPPG